MRTRTTTVAVLLTALALGAGCAAHKDDGAPVAGPRTIKPVQGCGKASWTDPADLAPGRTPARCDKGAPAPRPLAGRRTLTVATGTLNAEYVAPLRLALARGEFRKEGLDVRLKVLPTPEALPLLAKGDLDALWAAPEAAVVNGINGGFDIRWVAGNFSPAPRSKSGLWVRLKSGESASSRLPQGIEDGHHDREGLRDHVPDGRVLRPARRRPALRRLPAARLRRRTDRPDRRRRGLRLAARPGLAAGRRRPEIHLPRRPAPGRTARRRPVRAEPAPARTRTPGSPSCGPTSARSTRTSPATTRPTGHSSPGSRTSWTSTGRSSPRCRRSGWTGRSERAPRTGSRRPTGTPASPGAHRCRSAGWSTAACTRRRSATGCGGRTADMTKARIRKESGPSSFQ